MVVLSRIVTRHNFEHSGLLDQVLVIVVKMA